MKNVFVSGLVQAFPRSPVVKAVVPTVEESIEAASSTVDVKEPVKALKAVTDPIVKV